MNGQWVGEGRKRHRLKFQLGILVGRRPGCPDSQGAWSLGITSPLLIWLLFSFEFTLPRSLRKYTFWFYKIGRYVNFSTKKKRRE
jgi:hypothetical protein